MIRRCKKAPGISCFWRLTVLFLSSLLIWGCSQRQLFVDPSDNLSDGSSRQDSGNSNLQGSISGDLLLKYSPYRVTGNVKVDSLKSLNIEAGVKIYFDEFSSMTVCGKLFCTGNPNNPVIFSTSAPHWNGIVIRNSEGESLIQYTIVENIDISSLKDSSRNGSVEIINSSCSIRNSIFRNNRSKNGGALYLEGAKCIISNNLFLSNSADIFGGAAVSLFSSNQFINNTFSNNESFNYGGGLVLISPMQEEVQNNIFFLNRCRTGDPSIAINNYQSEQNHYTIKYNFIPAGFSDPGFISLKDFHLHAGSPCINAGNPSQQYNDADGSRNDQGAYGGPFGNW